MKWSWFINEWSLENEIPWKSWLDPQFPWHSERKWILKRLPPNRGHFNFIFVNRDGLLINSGTYFLVVILSYRFKTCRHCHAFYPWLMPCVLVLLIDNPSKKRWHGNFGSILDFPVTPSKFEIWIDHLSIGVPLSSFLRKKII